MLFGGGLVVLLILVVIVSSLLKGGGASTAPMLSVVQEQTELVRVATAGVSTSSEKTTQALALSVELSITSANVQLTKYATSQGIKLDPKLLTLKHSATADTQLAAAKSNDTYDATLISVLQNDLASYSQALKTAYSSAPGPKGRQLLSDQFDAAQLLIQQSKE